MTIPKPYSVQTFDAYESPPYSGDPLNVGSFSTAEEALECAKKVVDDQLRTSIESGLSAEEAVLSFSTAGEIPMIFGEGRIYLQPFEYAKKRASEIELEEHHLALVSAEKNLIQSTNG